MSSKGKSSAVVGGGAALVPTRRFPEFIGQPIQDVYLADATLESTERNGSGQTSTQIMGVSKVEGIVPMMEHVIAADTARYKCVRKDWFAYNPMRLNIGSIARWHGDDDILVSPDYVVFKCKSSGPHRLDPAYLDHFRRSDIWEAFVSEKGDGGVRVRIYYRDLALLPIALPTFPEQQKISDCLDSADALIEAQGRKVEALKAHKKGLMQQLFPQEGETQPRLRFPEFEGLGEWLVKPLGEMADVLMCKRIFAHETNPYKGVPFFKIGTLGGKADAFISREFFEDYKSRYNYPRRGEVLITCSGTVGKCLSFDGNDAYFQDSNIVWIDNPNLAVSNQFLFNVLSNVDWAKLNSTTIKRIYSPDLRSMIIHYPKQPREQQRIADCLTSLDNLIAAETRKLDTLGEHKKGLMQQLFPTIEESQS